MVDKTEMIVKIVDRIIFVEITMSAVVTLLSQIRNIPEYKLKSKVEFKTN